MVLYKGVITGKDRKVEFKFREKRRNYINVYNYIIELYTNKDILDILNNKEYSLDTLETYSDTITIVHAKLDNLIFELCKEKSMDLRELSRHRGYNWSSLKGMRDRIKEQLKFISKYTYFKIYNSTSDSIDELCMEVVENV